MKLKEALDKAATALIEKVKQKDTPLQESIDAFKAVTSYYAAQQKGRGKKSESDEDEESGGFSFGEAGNGGNPKVPARRNS